MLKNYYPPNFRYDPCLTNQIEIKQWLVVEKIDRVTTSEDTHTKKAKMYPLDSNGAF